MEGIQNYQNYQQHLHGQNANHQNQGQQYSTSSQGETSIVTSQQIQRNVAVPTGVKDAVAQQSSNGGIQTAGSFHSVSSGDSAAEMSKYFPDAQTPQATPISHQLGAEGQAQSTATSNGAVSTNVNTVNAGPYIPVSAPIAAQRLQQPLRPPIMAQQPTRPTQQQQQPPIRPSGIPSYPSQIEGLSVSQALINDVLVDLQSKVLNETVEQYHQDSSAGTYIEPLPPIYIRAPQPTVILQSDLNRLRAELNSRVRPPVVYRYPAGANQSRFQQQQFQQNTFQAPRFPAPPQQYIPPECYGQYPNTYYGSR